MRGPAYRKGREGREHAMRCPVAQLRICGPDAVRLRQFYADLFGWTDPRDGSPERGHPASIILEGGAGPAVMLCVEVEDPVVALTRAVALGGRILSGPRPMADGRVAAQLSDPAGNPICVVRAAGANVDRAASGP